MFDTEIKKLAGVLAGFMIVWLFGQTLLIRPLVTAVEDMQKANEIEHTLIVAKLQAIDSKSNANKTSIDTNEVVLFRVVDDTKENRIDIKDCQAFHFPGSF